MPETEIAVTNETTLEGQPIPFAAANVDGNYFDNRDSEVSIWVLNTAGVTRTVDFVTQPESNFGPYKNRTYTIPSGEMRPMPRHSGRRFNDLAGRCHLEYPDGVTNLQVAAIRLETILKDDTV